jgi:P pilus assembly chaperone PapD
MADMRTRPGVNAVLGLFLLGSLPAVAHPSFYVSQCTSCHSTTTTTCNGCHSHGTHSGSAKSDINITGTTNKSSYAPGETVTVTINGGYRTGWLRAVLLDQAMGELARSSCPGGMGGCTTTGYPATLTAPAPSTPGTYVWAVAWYGNKYDASGASFGSGTSATLKAGYFTPSSNTNHGFQTVALPAFTVASASAPAIAVSPTSLAFGTVTVGVPKTLALQVQNTGTATLNVTSVALCSGTTTRFSVSPASLTVAAGQSGTVNVTYTPTAAATDSGCIALTHNASNQASPLSVNLSGTGSPTPVPAIAVSPTSLAFGTVAVGVPKTLALQVQNTGTAALNVTSVALCSGTTTRFSLSPGSLTVAAGQSGTVNVTYTPTGAATDSGCIALTHNASNQASPLNVSVSATGAAAPAPAIAVSPTSLAFGTVMVGVPKTLALQVQNTGTATLNVTSIGLCSGTTTRFSVSPGSLTVAAGHSGTVNVTYTPTSAATDSGCIALTHNASNQASPLSVNLSGTGSLTPVPAIAVSPTSLAFGTVTVGTPRTLALQVQNTGTATLNVTSIGLCSGTTTRFSLSPGSLTVAAGQSGTVNVTYTPTGAATDSGCIALTHNASNQASPLSVNLSASGSPTPVPSMSLNPAALDFGTVAVGVPKTLALQIQNTGTATLNVTSVTLCSGTTTRFSFSPPSLTVAAGQSGMLDVTYTPLGSGTDSGCISLAHNASNVANPLQVSLTAIALIASPAASLDPASLDFGSVRIGTVRSLTTLVRNSGSVALDVSAIAQCSGTPAVISWSPAAPLSVVAGGEATLTVAFTPGASGALPSGACLELSTNDGSNSTIKLQLNGSGTSGVLEGIQGGCSSAAGPDGGWGLPSGLSLLVLLLAAVKARGRRHDDPRSERF